MKIAMLADLHFGVKKSDQIFSDSQLRFFETQMIDELKKRDINTIFVLGDVFDTRQSVNVHTQNLVLKLFKDTLKDFDIHILVGNHDLFYTTTTETNSLKMLDLLPNVKVYETNTKLNIGGHDIMMVPWITNNEEFEKTCDSSEYAFGHFEITGARMDKYNLCAGGISLNTLWEKFDHVYSGHFHTRSTRTAGNKDLTYIGSPYQITRIDMGDDRGVTVLDLDTNTAELIVNEKSMIFNKITYPAIPEDIAEFTAGNVVDVYVSYDDSKFTKKVYDYVQKFEVEGPAYPVNLNVMQKDDNTEISENLDGINLFSLFKSYIEDLQIKNKQEVYNALVELYNSYKGD